MEPGECASKWKSLQDKFVREVKKVREARVGMQGQNILLLGHSSLLWSS